MSVTMAGAIAQLNPAPERLAVWPVVALVGWGLAAFAAVVVLRQRAQRRERDRDEPHPDAGAPSEAVAELDGSSDHAVPRHLLQTLTPVEEGVAGVLRWLCRGTEATGVAFLEMAPGRGERLYVEPRGLPEPAVAVLTRRAREALLGAVAESAEGTAAIRWLGLGAPRVLVALEAVGDDAQEVLRFGRYLIEWVVSSDADEPLVEVERRIRAIPGVAWAELNEPGSCVRIALSDGASPAEVRATAERELAADEVRTHWVDVHAVARSDLPAPAMASPPRVGGSMHDGPDPRVTLIQVSLSEGEQTTADVRLRWKEQELRGRGHAGSTRDGGYLAGARAVADAIRPLLDSEVVVVRLYRAATEPDFPVLIADVRLEGERLVGAVADRDGDGHWTGARAVLDAVNRRLTQVAGRSGRL